MVNEQESFYLFVFNIRNTQHANALSRKKNIHLHETLYMFSLRATEKKQKRNCLNKINPILIKEFHNLKVSFYFSNLTIILRHWKRFLFLRSKEIMYYDFHFLIYVR